MHILHNQFARWKLIKYIISSNNIRATDRNFSEKLFLKFCLHFAKYLESLLRSDSTVF